MIFRSQQAEITVMLQSLEHTMAFSVKAHRQKEKALQIPKEQSVFITFIQVCLQTLRRATTLKFHLMYECLYAQQLDIDTHKKVIYVAQSVLSKESRMPKGTHCKYCSVALSAGLRAKLKGLSTLRTLTI